MKRLMILVILLLLPVQGWGAGYYIQKIGSNWKYLQNSWPSTTTGSNCSSNNINGCMNNIDGNGNTIIIHPGTYTGTDLSSSGSLQTKDANTVLRGPQPGDSDYATNRGAVVIDGSSAGSSSLFVVNNSGWSLQNLTFQGQKTSGKYCIDAMQSVSMSDVTVTDCDRGMLIRNGGTFSRMQIKNTSGSYAVYFLGNATTSTFNYSIFDNNIGYIAPGGNVVNVYNNCIFTGFFEKVIDTSSSRAVTMTFNNSIFSANNIDGMYQGIILTWGGGTWTFNNSILGDRPIQKATFLINQGGTANVAYNNCPNTYSPRWLSNKRSGNARISLQVDDAANTPLFYKLADAAAVYGFKAGIAMSYYGSSQVDWKKIARYITSGHELLCHVRSGTRLSTADVFVVTNPTKTINVTISNQSDPDSNNWAGTLTVSGEPPIDLQNSSYNTLPKLIAYLESKGISVSQATAHSQVNFKATDVGAEVTKSITLADTGGVKSLDHGYTLLFAQDPLFQVEMKESKAWLEGKIRTVTVDDQGNPVDMSAWTAKSLVWPGGYNSAASIAYALDPAKGGFLQARAAGYSTGTHLLQALNMGKAGAVNYYSEIGSVDAGDSYASVVKETEGLLDTLSAQGGISGIFSHSYSANDWAPILATISAYGIPVEKFETIMDWVRSNDDHVRNNVSYKCSTETNSCFADQSDYHLKPDSLAINSGITIPGTTIDIAGTPIPNGINPDLGAYQHKSGSNLSITSSISNAVGGSVTQDKVTAIPGDSVIVTIKPDAGYTLAGITDNGGAATAVEGPTGTFTYTIANVTANHTVVATFALNATAAPVPALSSLGLLGAFIVVSGLGFSRHRGRKQTDIQ